MLVGPSVRRSVGRSVTLNFFFAKWLIELRVRDLWRSALFSFLFPSFFFQLLSFRLCFLLFLLLTFFLFFPYFFFSLSLSSFVCVSLFFSLIIPFFLCLHLKTRASHSFTQRHTASHSFTPLGKQKRDGDIILRHEISNTMMMREKMTMRNKKICKAIHGGYR